MKNFRCFNYIRFSVVSVLLCAGLGLSQVARAEEDLETIMNRVNELVAQQNYTKAIAEIEWAKKALEKRHTAVIKEFFPPTLAGLNGEKIAVRSAFGLKSYTRTYGDSSAGESSLTVTLSAGPQQGGIAALEQVISLLGVQQNVETLRINQKAATLLHNERTKRSSLSVSLDNGPVVRFELVNSTSKSDEADADLLVKAAETFELEKLDSYLQGDL